MAILNIDRTFLLKYIKYLYSNKNQYESPETKTLAAVWLLDNIEDELLKVFDFISEKETIFGTLNHFCNSFFYNIKTEVNIKKSDKFIIGLCPVFIFATP